MKPNGARAARQTHACHLPLRPQSLISHIHVAFLTDESRSIISPLIICVSAFSTLPAGGMYGGGMDGGGGGGGNWKPPEEPALIIGGKDDVSDEGAVM